MWRSIDDYEYDDRSFNRRAPACHSHHGSARHHSSRHIGGGVSAVVAALVAIAVFLILQGLHFVVSQPASARLSVDAKEPPISRPPTDTRYVTADDIKLRAVDAKEPPISRPPTDTRYVTADDIKLRKDPSRWSVVSYILPRGTEVTLLGEAHRNLDSNVWLRVSFETPEGRQSGWVHERYVPRAKRDILQY